MKRYIANILFVCTCLTGSALAQVPIKEQEFTGIVVAYARPHPEVPPYGHVPLVDELIVKLVPNIPHTPGYVRLINEHFAEKSSLPRSIFTSPRKWRFKVIRRIDCDRPISGTSLQTLEVGDSAFTVSSSTNLVVLRRSLMRNVTMERPIPCYLIRSVRE